MHLVTFFLISVGKLEEEGRVLSSKIKNWNKLEKINEEILLDFIVIFEQNFSYLEDFDYKIVTKHEIYALESIIDLFDDIKTIVEVEESNKKSYFSTNKIKKLLLKKTKAMRFVDLFQNKKSLEKKSRKVDSYFLDNL